VSGGFVSGGDDDGMWALLVLLAALAAADVSTHHYKDGEEVILWVNKGKAALHALGREAARGVPRSPRDHCHV
jgi:hypothetical protein